MARITVYVKLFASLRQRFPGLELGARLPVELPETATVGHLIEHLALPADLIKVVFVNNTIRGEAFALSDGDQVAIFPPVGGG